MTPTPHSVPPDDKEAVCKSCNTPWSEHLGIQGTCAMLMEKDEDLEKLKAYNKDLDLRVNQAGEEQIKINMELVHCHQSLTAERDELKKENDGLKKDAHFYNLDRAEANQSINSAVSQYKQLEASCAQMREALEKIRDLCSITCISFESQSHEAHRIASQALSAMSQEQKKETK